MNEAVMGQLILLYLGAFLPFMWGVAHLFPTRNVVAGFGDISEDNRRIITMEWVIEGVALIFVGLLIVVVTYVDSVSAVSQVVYWLVVLLMVALAIVSALTGARIRFLPFRLCPVVFLASAILVLIGSF